ncbi:MAG: immunoglobulin domain-containing protein [Cyclonatronaceae bacterium]
MVSFVVNGRDSSLIGSSDLDIRFHRAVSGSNAPLPGPELGQVQIPITQLNAGNNRINVRNQNWRMEGGTEYYIVFEIEDSSSRIEFLLDPGSEDESNENYFPVRTQLYIEPPTVNQAGWYFYTDRNNILAAMRITGEYSGPLQAPEILAQPQTQGTSLGEEVVLSVQASGTPEPIYQWFKDDVPLYGENEAELVIEDMQPENEGRYNVRVSNPGGSLLSDAALLNLDFDAFALSQNFPNPVEDFTTFEFILPEAAQVSLRLFDVQGREVARIIDNQAVEAGLRQVEFQPPVASGIYFYQLRANGSETGTSFTKARKMIKL